MVFEMLVPQEKYLGAGVHIGTRNKSGSMRQFIYKAREDGLHVLDLKKMDARLRHAVNLLMKYPEDKVYVISNKDNARKPITKMCEQVGFQPLIGRFTPGRFTNPAREDFVEPSIVLVVDPASDRQSVKEAYEINVPAIALCDTNNLTKYLDLIIPTNNKGRKAIALLLWLFTRELLKAKGKIASDEEFTLTPEEFEA
ncbi:30S ribosomal protein S2 [Candidatus Micrarchaeota archaeon]|nr:30S ribosomal protein S2 [Candidatus Micrarchaeota archaeon]